MARLVRAKLIRRVLLAAAISAAPLVASGAGLGNLTVHSALGRPLNADIDIIALQPGELDTLNVGMASFDAYRHAGIEPSPVLSKLSVAIVRRGARAYVHLSSKDPINEPFLDVLVQLQWASGRLAREYTFLLDPPDYSGARIIASAPERPAAPSVARPPAVIQPAAPEVPTSGEEATKPITSPAGPPAAAGAQASATAPASGAAEATPASPAAPAAAAAAGAAAATAATPVQPQPGVEERPLPTEKAQAEAPPAEPAPPPPPPETRAERAPSPPERVESYEVVKGDTLSEIALRNLPEGVTLNQMLVALYRENPDAFIRENINLVRAGRILTIPDRDAAQAVGLGEANRLVVAHAAEFNAYRRRLAALAERRAAAAAAAESSSSGAIETAPPAPAPKASKDELKLSKADAKHPSSAMSKAATEDDLAARELALKEAQSRVADLEKNVADLQKLLELKNQQLAQLQNRAAGAQPPALQKPGAAPPAAAAAVGAATPKPGGAAAPTRPGTPTPPTAAKPAPAAPVAPQAAAPAPAAQPTPAPASTPAAAKPAPPAAKPPAPKPPAPTRPAQVHRPAPPPPAPSLLDEFLDDPVKLGGLGGVVLLLLGYGAWAWRRKKASQVSFQDSVLGPASSDAGASSIFGPGAASQAPGPSSVVLPSVSQGGGGAVETDEVDAIAEADVYMAYGRDAQAEEILNEALAKDPQRVAVHGKLLEIYANRHDAKAFEGVALKLQAITSGAGPDWEKAVALGRSIDPANVLYGGSGAHAEVAMDTGEAAPSLDIDLDAGTAPASVPDLVLGGGAPALEDTTGGGAGLDFDLGTSAAGAGAETDFSPGGTLVVDTGAVEQTGGGGLDFDIGTSEAPQAESGGGLDFELPSEPAADVAITEPAAEVALAEAAAPGGSALDFDLKLDVEPQPAAEAPAEQPAIDLSSISLDLGETEEAGAAAGADPKWQEVATKLDLAKAYQEMGDKDGASELLNEVLREGDQAQKSQAEQLLAALA